MELLPLVLWSIPIACFGGFILYDGVIALQRRAWNRHAEKLIARCETRQAHRIAEEILSDAELITSVQIQWLEDCLALPCAPEPA